MKNQMYGPILKSLGMFRSTLDKEDTEPIDKVFHYLNEVGDLVAMTPESKLERDVQIKAMAGIIKFAVAGEAPLPIEKRLNREKYRDQRYELAEDIINIIESLKIQPMEE